MDSENTHKEILDAQNLRLLTLKAEELIKTAFKDKTDKAGEPYIEHLYRVAYNVEFINYDINYDIKTTEIYKIFIISLLHDLIEDCPEYDLQFIKDSFEYDEIIEAIDVLTKKKNVNYDDYIENIAKNKFARVVKLADLRDNMDMTRLPEITDKDLERLKKYHKSFMFLLNYKD